MKRWHVRNEHSLYGLVLRRPGRVGEICTHDASYAQEVTGVLAILNYLLDVRCLRYT